MRVFANITANHTFFSFFLCLFYAFYSLTVSYFKVKKKTLNNPKMFM